MVLAIYGSHAPAVVPEVRDDVFDGSGEASLDHLVPSAAAAVQSRVELFREPAQRQALRGRDVPVTLRLSVRPQVLLPCRQSDEDAVAEVAPAVGQRADGVRLKGRQEHDAVAGRVRPGLFLQEGQRDVRLLHLCHGQFVGQVTVLRLQGFDGLILPGGFGKRGAEGIIAAAQYGRENKIPTLMIGYGMQLAVVEAVRNLLGMKNAGSVEVDPKADPAVVRIPADRVSEVNDSRSQARNGGYTINLKEGKLATIYGNSIIRERHGNRYEIDPAFIKPLEDKGIHFTGYCVEGDYPEAFEAVDHPFYVGVIYHPEFISRPNKAHPLFAAFISAAMN